MRKLEVLFAFFARFLPSFTSAGFRARSLFWDRLEPDFVGQVWIVTGASSGIGAAMARRAARCGADVLAIARSADKLEALVDQAGPLPGQILPSVVDCSLAGEIREFVAGLDRAGSKIDVLLNNVGVMLSRYTETGEAEETSFATNLLNQFLLTEALIAGDHFAADSAVINMSSGGMYNVPLSKELLDTAPDSFDGTLAYAAHKRAQVALADHWQAEYGDRGIAFYAMHPGWVDTPGVQSAMPQFRALLRPHLRNADQGADTAIWLAATRPDPRPDTIWFDRAARPAHIFARTRSASISTGELVEFLSARLDAKRTN